MATAAVRSKAVIIVVDSLFVATPIFCESSACVRVCVRACVCVLSCDVCVLLLSSVCVPCFMHFEVLQLPC